MSIRALFILWTALSLVGGAVGGWFGQRLFSAPFYFGFFLTWVLVGMAGLFVIAVRVENDRMRRTGEK